MLPQSAFVIIGYNFVYALLIYSVFFFQPSSSFPFLNLSNLTLTKLKGTKLSSSCDNLPSELNYTKKLSNHLKYTKKTAGKVLLVVDVRTLLV